MTTSPPPSHQESATSSQASAANALQGESTFVLPAARSGQVSFDDPSEAAHKRQLELDEAAHKRTLELKEINRQTAGQAIAMLLVVLVALGCLWVIVSNRFLRRL